MKKIKNLFITLGLSLAVGLGIGAGLSTNRDVKEAKADPTPSTIEYRFTNNYSWKYIKAYAWVAADDSQKTDWNTAMSEAYVNESDQQVYTVSLESKYDRIIFHGRNYENTDDVQTVDITIGDDHGFYLTGWSDGKATAGTYNLTNTFYFYDSNELLGASPSVYAYNDNDNTINNGSRPGVALCKRLEHNKNIYQISFDVMYNKFEIGNGTTTQNLATSGLELGHTLYFVGVDSASNSWWTDLDYVFAHNFNKNYMHMLDYDKDGTEGSTKGTGLCVSYYPLAKAAYEDFIADSGEGALGRNTMIKINDLFGNSLDRLSEWARINGETFTVTSKIGAFSAAGNILKPIDSNNDSIYFTIVLISFLTLATVSLFIFVRKRKENR